MCRQLVRINEADAKYDVFGLRRGQCMLQNTRLRVWATARNAQIEDVCIAVGHAALFKSNPTSIRELPINSVGM